MTKKYSVASCAMVFKMLGNLSLSPAISLLDRAAKKIINENARESDLHAQVMGVG
jgi:hypothetical protein